MRQIVLNRHPYCQCPHHDGKDKTARSEVVDHKTPHRGDSRLFWSAGNLQAMNKECHDKYKQSQEKGGLGFDRGVDANGQPLNKNSDWYKR